MVVILHRDHSKYVVVHKSRSQVSELARFQIFATAVVNVLRNEKVENGVSQELQTLVGSCYCVLTVCWMRKSFQQQYLRN